MIRSVEPSDCKQIAALYNYYIQNSTATFEEAPVDALEIQHRINEVVHKLPWLVFLEGDQLLGYAYATPWRARTAYRFSVEVSVYVCHKNHGRGIGSQLYAELFERLKSLEIHTIIGGITLPNEASIKLHENMGFRKVAEFQEVGYKFGTWLNVGYWQLHKL